MYNEYTTPHFVPSQQQQNRLRSLSNGLILLKFFSFLFFFFFFVALLLFLFFHSLIHRHIHVDRCVRVVYVCVWNVVYKEYIPFSLSFSRATKFTHKQTRSHMCTLIQCYNVTIMWTTFKPQFNHMAMVLRVFVSFDLKAFRVNSFALNNYNKCISTIINNKRYVVYYDVDRCKPSNNPISIPCPIIVIIVDN